VDIVHNLLNDDLIDLTAGNDKSPSEIDEQKSPTLSSYLKGEKPEEEEVKESDENFDIEDSLRSLGNSNDFTLLDPDFNSTNNLAVFRINNQLLINKYECNIMITPLKQLFTFKEKMEVNEDLIGLKQVYINFVYFPYDVKLIQLLRDN
jgi:hypothetical protein